METTFGQKLIGVDFAATDAVSKVKQEYAAKIDQVIDRGEGMISTTPSATAVWEESWRERAEAHEVCAEECLREAIKQFELAAMLKVKSMTQGRRLDTDIRLGRNQEAT